MGLFSKSSSSSTTQNFNDSKSSTFGDLSSNNLNVQGSYTKYGLNDEGLREVLNFVKDTNTNVVDKLATTANSAMSQANDRSQISSTATGELKPILTLATIAFIAWVIFKK